MRTPIMSGNYHAVMSYGVVLLAGAGIGAAAASQQSHWLFAAAAGLAAFALALVAWLLELYQEWQRLYYEKAAALEYEAAAKIRDQIQAVEKTLEKQRMVSHWGNDQDIFGLYREGGFIEVQVLLVRHGKMTGSQCYALEDLEFPDEEIVGELLAQFYQGNRFIPDEIFLPVAVEDREVREEYLSERRGKKLTILAPQRGDKRRLVEMAIDNARQGWNC